MDSATYQNDSHKDECWKYLDALQIIAEAIGCSITTDQIFQQTLDTIVDVTKMDGAGFRIFDKAKNTFQLVAQYSITPDLFDYLRSMSADNRLHGKVLKTRQPEIMSDMTQDPRVVNREILKLGHRSLICIPVLCGDEVVGTLDLLSYKMYQWSENEIRLLMSIGRILGLEIKHVQLTEQIREISIFQERQRISWEIHDGLSQMISSIKMRTETIEFLLDKGDNEKLRKVYKEISDISDDAYDSLREEIIGLRGTIQDKGFILTLTEQLNRLERQWGIKTQINVKANDNELICPPHIELQMLRIFQEAIANVRRHANANHLDVEIEEMDDYIQMVIVDDGQGFEKDGNDEKHAGLRIMRERAESIGGEFKIDTSPGCGTRMVVILPKKSDYFL